MCGASSRTRARMPCHSRMSKLCGKERRGMRNKYSVCLSISFTSSSLLLSSPTLSYLPTTHYTKKQQRHHPGTPHANNKSITILGGEGRGRTPLPPPPPPPQSSPLTHRWTPTEHRGVRRRPRRHAGGESFARRNAQARSAMLLRLEDAPARRASSLRTIPYTTSVGPEARGAISCPWR